jgi:hypothetical protein
VPDVPAIAFHVYYRLIRRWPEDVIQRADTVHFWRTATMVLHAFPIWLVVLGVALWRRSVLVSVFAASVLLHAALDLPVHHGDAIRQFWPISDYRFISPVSYWDPNVFAAWMKPIEVALLSGASWPVWRRYGSRWLRSALVVTNGVMAIVLLTGRHFW